MNQQTRTKRTLIWIFPIDLLIKDMKTLYKFLYLFHLILLIQTQFVWLVIRRLSITTFIFGLYLLKIILKNVCQSLFKFKFFHLVSLNILQIQTISIFIEFFKEKTERFENGEFKGFFFWN